MSTILKVENILEESIWKTLLELGVRQDFNFGDIVYKQNEPSPGLTCFQQGKIELCTILPCGLKKDICMVGTPHILGETSVIDGGVNICTAIARAKTKVVFVPKEIALEILLSNPNIMNAIMSAMAKKIRFMQTQVEDAAFRLPQKLARLLLSYNEYTESPCKERLIVTHDELASFLGTTRPKITRYLNEFYMNGLIEKGRGDIRIKDYEGLKRISGKFSEV